MAQAKAKKSVDLESGTVTFAFNTSEDTEPLVVNIAELPDEIKKQALLHGISQKVGDSYAGADDAEEARETAEGVIAQIMAGTWRAAGGGGGGGGPRTTVLAEALAKALNRDLDECVEMVADMDDKRRTELKKHPQVASVYAEIQAERAAAKAAKLAEKANEDAAAPSLASMLEG